MVTCFDLYSERTWWSTRSGKRRNRQSCHRLLAQKSWSIDSLTVVAIQTYIIRKGTIISKSQNSEDPFHARCGSKVRIQFEIRIFSTHWTTMCECVYYYYYFLFSTIILCTFIWECLFQHKNGINVHLSATPWVKKQDTLLLPIT